MRIWFDILTPKEILFFEPMAKELKARGHDVLCTSRRYKEAHALAAIRRFPVVLVGRHGGAEKLGKLEASLQRMKRLTAMISEFSPDLTVSFCSPEAARVSYGLGFYHAAFNDAPHHDVGMRLTLPMIQRLFTPWMIPKSAYTRYGFDGKRISRYRAIDAGPMIRRASPSGGAGLPYAAGGGALTILIRPVEEQAAYVGEKEKSGEATSSIVRGVLDRYAGHNVVVLSRYADQKARLGREFGSRVRLLDMAYDGKILLENCDAFVGSGGTMTAEAALMGVPTVSYDAVPNVTSEYLGRRGFLVTEKDPAKIAARVGRLLASGRSAAKRRRAERFVASMEDPYSRLAELVSELGGSGGARRRG